MLSTSKTHQKMAPIYFSVGITLVIWLLSKWYYNDWFENPFKYPAKTASLSATVLMCWTILLSTRWKVLENFFGGLDKVYQIHKRAGKFSFFFIIFHPLFLALNKLPDISDFLKNLWFQPSHGSRYISGYNLGILALLIIIVLISITLWVKIPYHRWKRSHEWFGFVLLVSILHILFVDADIAAYPVLRVWMYFVLFVGICSFVYTRFFYSFTGPHYKYKVNTIETIADVLEITFTPIRETMDFKPSQFVYMVVNKQSFSSEPHPYSIACGYNLNAEIKLGVKMVGDYTKSLNKLQSGDKVTFYGPYGHFSDKFLSSENNSVFIGAGIGITPFIGMWHVALHSEDRRDPNELPQQLQQMHPELIKTWRSPLVSLFYIARTKAEASFDNDIINEIESSHLHNFEQFEQRGHYYELYCTSDRKRITVEYIDQHVKWGIKDKNIYICGPTQMVNALNTQLNAMGVKPDQIIIEDFNLV